MKSVTESIILYIAVFIALFYVLVPGLTKSFLESITGVSIIFIGIITIAIAILTYSATCQEKSKQRKFFQKLGMQAIKSALYYLIATATFVFYSLIFSSSFVSEEVRNTLAQKGWFESLIAFASTNPEGLLPTIGLVISGLLILLIFTKSGELIVSTIAKFLLYESKTKKKVQKINTKITQKFQDFWKTTNKVKRNNNFQIDKVLATIAIILTVLFVYVVTYRENVLSALASTGEFFISYLIIATAILGIFIVFILSAFLQKKGVEALQKNGWFNKFQHFGHFRYVLIYFIILFFYWIAGVILSQSMIINIGGENSAYVGTMAAFLILILYRFFDKYASLKTDKYLMSFLDFKGIMVSVVFLFIIISAARGGTADLPKGLFTVLLITIPAVDAILIDIINLPAIIKELPSKIKKILKH